MRSDAVALDRPLDVRRAAAVLARIGGAAGLLVIVGTVFVVMVAAAGHANGFVVDSRIAYPDWLAGPLRALSGPALTRDGLITALWAMSAAYLVVLLVARRRLLSGRGVAAAIIAVYALVLIGPLASTDPFGYIAYARLPALHGLDPYTHGADALAGDPVQPWLIWHGDPSPYGPLFTVLSLLAVPFGVAGGVWIFKGVAVFSWLAVVFLVVRAARALGRDPVAAAAFAGLNPLVLLYTVAGGHNDGLMFAGIVGVLVLLLERRDAAAGAAAAAAIAIKAVAVAPLLLLAPLAGRLRRVGMGAIVAGVLIALAAFLALGTGVLGAPAATLAQQDKISAYSVLRVAGDYVGFTDGEALKQIAAILRPAVLVFLGVRVWRGANPVTAAAWAVIAIVTLSVWCKPWYAAWVLPLAALSPARGPRVAAIAFCAFLFAMKAHLIYG